MARPCSICTHADRLEIEKAILESVPFRQIALRYGMSAVSVRRHKEAHLSGRLVKAAEKKEQKESQALVAVVEKKEALEVMAGRELLCTAERILQEESCLAYSDLRSLFDEAGSMVNPRDLPEEVARSVSSIEVVETTDKDGEKTTKYKYKFWDKGRALARLEAIKGMTKPADAPPAPGNTTNVQINILRNLSVQDLKEVEAILARSIQPID